jgi:hypothetical protein
MAFYENGEVRLVVSADRGGRGLIGGADFGDAITEANIQLADDLAAALRTAGYTKAVLVLDAQESLDAPNAARNKSERTRS